MKRGEVWWADLPAPRGSAPAYRRPVLVIQADSFNRSAIGTVVVAALTSNLRLAKAPGNVALTKREGKLPKASVVNVSQILSLDRARLTKRVRRLPAARMTEVEAGLRLVLALA